jgi:small-conductance mechanosensitive channel
MLDPKLLNLLDDLRDPSIVWQVATLAGCLLCAWVLERRVLDWWRRSRAARLAAAGGVAGPAAGAPDAAESTRGAAGSAAAEAAAAAAQAALEALGRVLLPVFALGLLLVARPVLGVWHNTQLLRVAIALLLAMALARTVVYAVSKLARTPGIAAFERLLVALVWVGVLLHLTGFDAAVVDFFESIVFPIGRQRVSLWTVLSGGFWVLATLLAALWLGGAIESRLLTSDVGDAGVRAVLSRVLRAVLLLVAVLVGLSLVGLDITALSVFGGALGVGLGLGLQRIASSYVSGFVVLLERRVRIGDQVTVDKYTGAVSEIRSRFTIVKSGEGWEAIVPNEMLMINPVQNFSTNAHLRLKTSLTLGYDTDLERVLPLLAQAAAGHPAVLKEPPSVAHLTGFGADGFTVDVGYSIGGSEKSRSAVQSQVNLALWALIRGEGVSLPYPQRDVRVLGLPDGVSKGTQGRA